MSQGPKKQFVKFTNFDDNQTSKNRDSQTPKHREIGKYKGKKNYLEKSNTAQSQSGNVENEKEQSSISVMLGFFSSVKITPTVEELVKAFPKFFANISHQPEKQNTDNLNDFVIVYSRKPHNENSNFTKPTIAQTMLEESDDPDWNTGSEEQFNLQSKQIDEQLKKKIEENLNNITSKRKDELRRHEKEFLQDHFRSRKRMQEQGQLDTTSRLVSKNDEKEKPQQKTQKPSMEDKSQNKEVKVTDRGKSETLFENWLGMQNKSQGQNCWIQKIQNDDETFGDLQFAQDDDNTMFELADQKSNQTSSDQDDAFVDENPTVVHKKINHRSKQTENEQNTSEQPISNAGMGTVLINSYIFSNIVQKIGLPPASCIWVISNRKDRYKVSTEYMDKIYMQQQIYEHYPFISLNHSDFVHNNDVNTERGFEKLKQINERKIRAQIKQQKTDDRKPYSYQKGKQQNNYVHKKR